MCTKSELNFILDSFVFEMKKMFGKALKDVIPFLKNIQREGIGLVS